MTDDRETLRDRGRKLSYRRLPLAAQPPADSDGIWLITLSDLLTLLLVFFIFCFLVARSSGTREKAPNPRATPLPVAAPQEPTPWSVEEGKLLSAISALRTKDGVSLQTGKGEVIITLKERVTFRPGQAQVLPSSEPVLDTIGATLKANPSLPVEIAGYTDNVPINTARYRSNWELSVARATNVLAYLVRKYGLDPSRFSVTGHADLNPLMPNDTPEHRAENRRVEIRLKEPKGQDGGGGPPRQGS